MWRSNTFLVKLIVRHWLVHQMFRYKQSVHITPAALAFRWTTSELWIIETLTFIYCCYKMNSNNGSEFNEMYTLQLENGVVPLLRESISTFCFYQNVLICWRNSIWTIKTKSCALIRHIQNTTASFICTERGVFPANFKVFEPVTCLVFLPHGFTQFIRIQLNVRASFVYDQWPHYLLSNVRLHVLSNCLNCSNRSLMFMFNLMYFFF